MTIRRHWPSLILLLATALLGGCAVLGAPERPAPVPTVVPAAYTVLTLDELRDQTTQDGPFTGQAELTLDGEILAMMEEVSRQNLIGYVRQLESFGTRHSFSAVDRPDWGIGAARNWIFQELDRVGGERLEVRFEDYPLSFQGLFATQRNIVAALPGSDPDADLVVLMANYDTRAEELLDGESPAPGADDNASGVAAMLEIARLMSARTWRQTVVFVATTAEEQGTFGSRNFVQNTLLDGYDIHAAINNDMIGGRSGIPQSVRLFAAGPDDSEPMRLGRYIHLLGSLYMPEFPVTVIDQLDREGRWGDQREFVRLGLPAVRLIESEEDLDIQNSELDTWSRIDFDYLRKVTQVNLVAMANMAATVDPPEPPVVTNAGNGAYTVRWDADIAADGYAVVFRPLNALTMETARFYYAGALQAGEITLSDLDPATLYGVSLASLDRQGRMSLFSREVLAGP